MAFVYKLYCVILIFIVMVCTIILVHFGYFCDFFCTAIINPMNVIRLSKDQLLKNLYFLEIPRNHSQNLFS